MKIMRVILVVLVCVFCLSEIHAQNNPYKIQDNLYDYYRRVDANIQSEKVLKIADTMFLQAKKQKDLKAQCLALYSKQRHYHAVGDLKNEIIEFDKVSPFILKTPYLQYYFGMWSNIIVRYINDNNKTKAVTEITKLRKKAMSLKNRNGIYSSYVLHAHLYFQASHFRIALSYYRIAYDYAVSHKISEYSSLYLNMARCCLYLRNWSECKQYLDMIDNQMTINSFSTRIYALYLSRDCCKFPLDSTQVEKDYNKLIYMQKNYPVLTNDQFLYDEALYYYHKYYKKDIKTANLYKNKDFDIYSYFDNAFQAQTAESQKDYKNAAENYRLFVEGAKKMNNDDEQYLIDEFVPQLDFYNIAHENSELHQRNEQLKLNSLKRSQDVLRMIEHRNLGRLITNKREHSILMDKLKAQAESINQQNRMLKYKQLQNSQRVKSVSLTESKNIWRLWFFLISVLSIIILFDFYAIENYMKRKRLKAEKEKAERANYIKSMFFQNMNHEIRTPLNAISGFNDLLNGEMAGELSAEEKKEFVNMITINSDLLITLVNDVIELSNYKSGTYRLNITDVDIDDVCAAVVESIRGRQHDGVQLTFVPTADHHFVLHTDAQRLQQILINYLTNACKHTDSGSIVLSYEVMPEQVRFSVTDTGEGVKEEDAENIFERFNMSDTKKSGTGLGLHICRIIAGLLRGKVYLDTAYKRGARFVFDHPRVLTVLLLFCFLFPSPRISAANKYHVDNQFYKMFEYVQTDLGLKEGKQYSDKMYTIARKKQNKTALCMALAAQIYFYNKGDNSPFIMQKFRECQRLSRETRYYNFVYDVWANIVTTYLQRGDFKSAKSELADLYKVVSHAHSDYGMGVYAYLAGNFYFVQHQYAATVFYFQQSLQYPISDKSSIYIMMAQSYFKMDDIDKTIVYARKSLNTSIFELNTAIALVQLMECYCKKNMREEAQETYQRLLKINTSKLYPSILLRYHQGLFYYYTFIENDKEKAIKEKKLSDIDDFSYENGLLYLRDGEYEEACKRLKFAAESEKKWMTSNYDDINNFYIGKFDYRESLREQDSLKQKAISLKIKDARNVHQLMKLKQEQTLWLLRQDELISKDKLGKWRLQSMMLARKKAEYQKQNIVEKGLKRQKDLLDEKIKWKTLTLVVIAVFVILFIIMIVRHLRASVNKLKVDAIRAKREEQAKTKFFDSINRQIRGPIDTIISLNQKLNMSTGVLVSEEERKSDVRELDNETSYLNDFINDVLNISKIESGTYKINNKPCNIDQLCKSAIESVKAPQKIEHVSDCKNASVRTFVCDSILIQWTVSSFLQFALSHTDKVDSIILKSVLSSESLMISVSFVNNQIKATDLETLFDFGKDSGNGDGNIGLYKSRLIANLLHGIVYARRLENDRLGLFFKLIS